MTVKTILRNKGSEVISVRPQLPLVEVARILVQRFGSATASLTERLRTVSEAESMESAGTKRPADEETRSARR